MTRIIEKRRALHKNLQLQQLHNNDLKFQVSQLQALANIGVTTCMIAHEINNLLTPISNYAVLALKNPDDKLLTDKALAKIAKNCDRASKIMKSILAVADGQAQEGENVRLLTLIEEIFTCLCRDFAKDRITVELGIPADLTVWAAGVEIQQVLMNLILNARDAMLPAGGFLKINASRAGDSVRIEVIDTGTGIKSGDLKKIFEPFFTTKAGRKTNHETTGSGLGLAFCKKIVDGYNGSITVESEPDIRTSFVIMLPKPPESDSNSG